MCLVEAYGAAVYHLYSFRPNERGVVSFALLLVLLLFYLIVSLSIMFRAKLFFFAETVFFRWNRKCFFCVWFAFWFIRACGVCIDTCIVWCVIFMLFCSRVHTAHRFYYLPVGHGPMNERERVNLEQSLENFDCIRLWAVCAFLYAPLQSYASSTYTLPLRPFNARQYLQQLAAKDVDIQTNRPKKQHWKLTTKAHCTCPGPLSVYCCFSYNSISVSGLHNLALCTLAFWFIIVLW